jgi:hypothetical protein
VPFLPAIPKGTSVVSARAPGYSVASGTGVAVVVINGAGIGAWGAVPVQPQTTRTIAITQNKLKTWDGFIECRRIYKGKIILECIRVFDISALLFFAILAGGSLFIFVFSLWTHRWVYLIGGRKGFIQTLHVILCSMTPNLLLGWIPLVGMLSPFWTLILMFFGIRELQEMSDCSAIGVIVLSVIHPFIILVVLIVLAFVYAVSSGGLFSPYSPIQ